MEQFFRKVSFSEATTLGVEYDYGSLMHYGRFAFSVNGNATIVPTVGGGERQGFPIIFLFIYFFISEARVAPRSASATSSAGGT